MIERLHILNFRCLENFQLDLAGRPSALLIGKNGAGKSTVLQCLKLFQSLCRGSGRVGNLISASDFTEHRTDHPMRFEVELALANGRYKYAVSLEWPGQFREARILDENHLSLSEVGQFITGLRKMTNRNGQFIATTHHPETVRKFSDETTLVLTRKSHLDPIVVRPLSDFTYQGDLINALIRDEIIG